ncbi:MAG TPA: DnaB-like helicase C-terminal domain-containing protein [Granulicella sp.]|jgi:replicative DNA helicase
MQQGSGVLNESEDVERTILGAILLDNHAYDEAEQITCNDFALSSHRTIFRRMAAMFEDGRAVDEITLVEELRNHHEIDVIGGVAYVCSLTELLPRQLSIESYVQIVKEKSRRRALIILCNSTTAMAADQSIDIDELLGTHDTRVLEISAESRTDAETLLQASERAFTLLQEHKSRNSFVGLSTGIDDLDRRIGGWVEGELAIIAGKPGQGKSSALIQTLVRCGKDGVPALLFSPEMTQEQVLYRIWAAVAGVPFIKLRHPKLLQSSEERALRAAKDEVAQWPLIIDADPNLTAAQLASRARISKRRYGTRLVGIDYLQKLRFLAKPDHRNIEVGDAAVMLTNLAKKDRLAVVALSSLTEKSGRGRNAAPSLGDLRQSGDIQYEASTVVIIHREVDENEHTSEGGQMIIAKQRGGSTGQFDVRFNDRLMFDTGDRKPEPAVQRQYELSRESNYAG